MLDGRTHKAFESDHIKHAVTLASEFAAVCHSFLFELANDIHVGRIVPAPREAGGMSMRVEGGMVHF